MTPEEAKEQFDEANDALIARIRCVIWGVTQYVWRVIPHEHRYTASQWCNRCWRSDYERLAK